MKIFGSLSSPCLKMLLIAGGVVFQSPVSLGDTVYVLSGNPPKNVSTILGVTGVEIRISKESSEETVCFTTESGREISKPLDLVIQLNIEGETSFNQAEADFANGDIRKTAAAGYRKALSNTTRQWIRLRAETRLLAIAANAGDLEGSVSAFIIMAKRDPAAATRHRPVVARARPEQLGSAIGMLSSASKGTRSDVQHVLSPLLEELRRAQAASATSAPVKNALPQPAAPAANPAIIAHGAFVAVQQALAGKDYERALKLLEAIGPTLITDADRGIERFLVAEVELGQSRGKASPVQLKALIERYVKVVRQFSDSDAAGFPHCTELEGKSVAAIANLRIGEILELLEQPEPANLFYQHVVNNYPDPVRSTAVTALARLNAAPRLPTRAEDQISGVAALEASANALERLIEKSPDEDEHRIKLANCYASIGILRKKSRQFEESLKVEHRAVELRERLVASKPADLDRQSWLGASYNNYGMTVEALGKPEEALRNYETAIKHQQIAFDAAPTVPQYRRFLRNHYFGIGTAQLSMKNPTEAARAALKCVQLLPRDGDSLRYAAGQLAQCAALAAEKNLPTQDNSARQRYVDQSIQTLRQALDAGYAPRESLDRDPAFEAIRSDSEFQKLLHLPTQNASVAEDSRRRWKGNRSTIVYVTDGEWNELPNAGGKYVFRELSRTDAYIEMVDMTRASNGVYFRIEANRLLMKWTGEDVDWRVWDANGAWENAARNSPK